MRRKKLLNNPTPKEIREELDRVKTQKRYIHVIYSTISSLVTVAAVSVLLCVLLVPVFRIYGSSMEPTLYDGNIVLAVKGSKFETGDLVGFYYNNKILVKRVIASSGDWLYIDETGDVTVNDVPLEEPYVTEKALGECDIELPYQVPEGRFFVMGDHRATSVDSRSSMVGCAAQEQIVGKIVFRIWPLQDFGVLK